MSYTPGYGKQHDRNQEATVWVGGLEPQCTDALVYELMVNAGPVVDVALPRDKVTGTHQGYAFVEYSNTEDAEYAVRIFNLIRLYGKSIKVNKASKDTAMNDVGANLFIGNLHSDVDEKVLQDTFSSFGAVVKTNVIRDENGQSKGFGFVNFDSFEASDKAIEIMNGQFLSTKPISVQYAYKEGTTTLHGDAAERLLAKKQKPNHNNMNTNISMNHMNNNMNRNNMIPPPLTNHSMPPPPMHHMHHPPPHMMQPPPMNMNMNMMQPPMNMNMMQPPMNMNMMNPPPLMPPQMHYPPQMPPQMHYPQHPQQHMMNLPPPLPPPQL